MQNRPTKSIPQKISGLEAENSVFFTIFAARFKTIVMKHLSLSFLLIILICSCGNATKNDSNVGSAQETNAENTESSANASGKKAQKGDEDIIARVKAIYEDVFNEYNEALESESIPQSSPDEKYCSADWNKVLDKVTEFDAVNNPD
jgi:hypothetical protein